MKCQGRSSGWGPSRPKKMGGKRLHMKPCAALLQRRIVDIREVAMRAGLDQQEPEVVVACAYSKGFLPTPAASLFLTHFSFDLDPLATASLFLAHFRFYFHPFHLSFWRIWVFDFGPFHLVFWPVWAFILTHLSLRFWPISACILTHLSLRFWPISAFIFTHLSFYFGPFKLLFSPV